ncbi:androgen-dependent TFPI-regulating protein [Nematolebias whitei]|uniref:androgen-dependent TFPI-regulating protein n=1 Tax=Nematolebias whitei TaxID=451745 RepID=UPI00189C4E7E|nr:androgen-dependent TFPI-regulating protein [Nematolebias whitei]
MSDWEEAGGKTQDALERPRPSVENLLQMAFFGLAAVSDLHQEETKSSLHRWKDLLFSVFAFPVGMFVVLLFWTIFAFDRELVYPATIDTFFPPWMNHAMHTFVVPVLLGEVLLQPHTYPKTKPALTALGVVGLAYLSWIIWVYLSVGIWVYPLLGYFSAAGLMGFFLFNMSVVTLLYLLGEELDSRVWSKAKSPRVFLIFILCISIVYISVVFVSIPGKNKAKD